MKKYILFELLCCLFISNLNLFAQANKLDKFLAKKYSTVVLSSDNKIYNVTKNSKKGICNLHGKEIIPCKYDDVRLYDNHYDVVLNGKKGACNISGKEIIPCKYDNIIFLDTYCKTELDGKKGACNLSGKEMVPCKYDDVILFDDHKYYTELNNKKGIYDSAGKEIFACVYDQILFFEKNHTYFAKLNGKKGVYDSSGKEIIPCKYDDIFFLDTYFATKLDGKDGVCDLSGKEIIPCRYESITRYDDHYNVYIKEMKASYDLQGNILTDPHNIINSEHGIKFAGNWTYQVDNSKKSVQITGDKILNKSSVDKTGDITIRLYLTDAKYSGGAISGYILAEHQLGALEGGYYYHDINQLLNFYSTPRDEAYYVTLCLLENKNGLSIKDYLNFDAKLTIDSPSFLERLSNALNRVGTSLNNNSSVVPNGTINNTNKNGNVNRGHMENITCSFCNGTGENPAEEHAPSFGLASTSHYHRTCPSCMGKGYIRKFVP